ncbi:MAG: amidohydrolase family protein [Chitinophagales bacterium]
MKKIFFFLLLTAFAKTFHAQSFDTLQQKSILLTNAIVHIGNGTVYENGVIGFENGKITLVGDATTMRYDQSKFAEIIDCAGKHIYPGLIALNTPLGLREIDAARATVDNFETGAINPNIRSLISYNTDSKVIPTIRSNGILLAQVVPQGGLITGTSSVMKTDGWNWEDAVYAADNAMHINWPGYYTFSFEEGNFRITVNKNYSDVVNSLKVFFDEAKAYSAVTNHAVQNVKFEAMRDVFEGKTKLFMHANAAKDIINAVQFAKQYQIVPVIVGGDECYKILSFLKENNVPIILSTIHNLPVRNDDDIIQPYKLPSILQQADIQYCISYNDTHWNMRNLPFLAGTAAANGLTKEQALQSITLSAARILGIETTVGSLDPGKDATLIICEGDVLDMKSSIIKDAYIQGIKVETKNWQDDSYEKYSKKYGIKVR